MGLHFVEELREMLDHLPAILKIYREDTEALLVPQNSDFLPREVFGCFGVEVIRYPSGIRTFEGCTAISGENFPRELFDFFVFPDALRNSIPAGSSSGNLFFEGFAGYGEDAAVMLHASLDKLLQQMGKGTIKEIDVAQLQKKAELHNTMRRLVRGIASLRREFPGCLSYGDLMTVFDAAMAFPPELVLDHLEHLMTSLQQADKPGKENRLECMVYGGTGIDPELFEKIEESGVAIAEDDHCNGRRQFDLSVNAASEYVFYELLDALTYRPLCPLQRPPEERYELLYRLLRNHNIDAVVFLRDCCCPRRLNEMEYLRVRLMRDGIDPVIAGDDALSEINRYLARIKK